MRAPHMHVAPRTACAQPASTHPYLPPPAPASRSCRRDAPGRRLPRHQPAPVFRRPGQAGGAGGKPQEANRNGTTVGSLFGSCSYGKSRLTAANSLVAPLVKLPCEGIT